MKKILVLLPLEDRHKEELEKSLSGVESDYELLYTGGIQPTPEQLKDASIVFGPLNPDLAKYAEKAEWFQLSFAGADTLAAPGVISKDAVLTNAVGAYGLTVGEHMLAQTFAMVRRFGQYGRNQVNHVWQTMGRITSVEGSVIAVLGTGDIGGFYARMVKALGAYVIGVRKNNREKPEWLDEQYTVDQLDDVLPRADIVAMVMPGRADTYHIMDETRLRKMKKGAYILNVGRGSAIELDGLKKVLKEGHLAGAALDVTEPEPLPADDELWDYDNVILTPHAAGNLFLPETLNRIVHIMADNLHRWVAGEPLRNVVKH